MGRVRVVRERIDSRLTAALFANYHMPIDAERAAAGQPIELPPTGETGTDEPAAPKPTRRATGSGNGRAIGEIEQMPTVLLRAPDA